MLGGNPNPLLFTTLHLNLIPLLPPLLFGNGTGKSPLTIHPNCLHFRSTPTFPTNDHAV